MSSFILLHQFSGEPGVVVGRDRLEMLSLPTQNVLVRRLTVSAAITMMLECETS